MTVASATAERQVSVISYNVHKGMNTGNRRSILREIREALRNVDADIVFLQEVVGAHNHNRYHATGAATTSQFEYLADSLWKHYAYGRNAVYDQGHHGNAILSRYPIEDWHNFDLSQTRFERRGLLYAEIRIPNLSSTFYAGCVHLNLMQHHRRRQVAALAKYVNEMIPLASPLIIAGDFNDWRGTASAVLGEYLNLKEAYASCHGSYARTFPSIYPVLQLDRVYLRGFEAQQAEVLDEAKFRRLSDHLGLRVSARLCD